MFNSARQGGPRIRLIALNAVSTAVFDGIPLNGEGDQETLFNEINNLVNEFDVALRNSITEVAREKGRINVVSENWEDVVQELDVSNFDALYNDIRDVVDKLSIAICEASPETLNEEQQRDVRIGVARAYAAVLEEFRDRVEEGDVVEPLRTTSDTDVVNNVDAAIRALGELEVELMDRGTGEEHELTDSGSIIRDDEMDFGLKDPVEMDSELLKETLEIEMEGADTYNDYAAVLAHQGRYDEAVKNLEKALEKDPEHIHALNNLGLVLTRLERYSEAKEKLEKALDLDRGSAALHNNYANLLKRLGKGGAENHFEKALELDPREPEPYNDYAVYLAKNDSDKADEMFIKALELDPEYGVAHSNYAAYLFMHGRLEEAEEHFRLALDLDPPLPSLHHNYALYCVDRGWIEEALESFHESLEMDPGFLKAYYGLNALLLREDRINDCVTPDMEDVEDVDGVLDLFAQLVDVAEQEGEHQLALDWCEEALGFVDSYDAEDRKQEFGVRYSLLSARDPDGATIETYGYAIRYVLEGELEKGMYLFREAWRRRGAVRDGMIRGVALSAGVGFLAHLKLFGVDVRQEYGGVVEEVVSRRDELTYAASVLLDWLLGNSDVGPEELLDRVEVSGDSPSVSLSQMELLAYARLLEVMEKKKETV